MDKLKKYMSEIGRKGGKAGRGESKRRDPDHYKKMVEARNKNKDKNSTSRE